MNKFAMVFALSLAIVGASFAQKAATKAPTTVSCAVMADDKVDVAKATAKKMYADYKGRRYFFCCEGCPDAFKKNPAKYAKKAQSIPTPKMGKKSSKA